ncbi:MAG: FmdE family protein [Candidatus Thermoplasmatota archaeon]|nr:FmdE family protein [Candidatus Thermoplasmatota archaeon]
MSAISLDEQIALLEENGISGEVLESMSRASMFHGHICPGLAIGVSASLSFLKGKERSGDEEIVAIVENDSCGVDGIQALLGCTFGKGNLIFKDHGKSVYTFFDRNTGRGWRYSLKEFPEPDDGAIDLFNKVRSEEASPEEKDRFGRLWVDRAARVLEAGENLFDTREVDGGLPEKARIFDSFICPGCGEKTGAHRSVEIDGERYCIPCLKGRS